MHRVHSPKQHIATDMNKFGLKQKPATILFLSMSPSDLAVLSRAIKSTKPNYTVSASNPIWFDPESNLLEWCHDMLGSAKLVILRILGGYETWSQGCDLLIEECRENKVPILLLSADDNATDIDFEALSTLRGKWAVQIASLLKGGSVENYQQCLSLLENWLKGKPCIDFTIREVPKTIAQLDKKISQNGHVLILGYRAWWLAGDVDHINTLQTSLKSQGLSADILMIAGLKDEQSILAIKEICNKRKPHLIISCLGFSAGDDFCKSLNIPWLQVFASAQTHHEWQHDPKGLTSSDLIMQIAMPELDGRIAPRCIAFRHFDDHDQFINCPVTKIKADPILIKHTISLAQNWIQLAKLKNSQKKVACIVANYPSSDGRIANGVGLDTLASIEYWITQLHAQGYNVKNAPNTPSNLIKDLMKGPTNQNPKRGFSNCVLSLESYNKYFYSLPKELTNDVVKRWGVPEKDPFFRKKNNEFHLPILDYGSLVIGIQPARGWDINPDDAVHDPKLEPTHNYIAFYVWLRHYFNMNVLVHFGKHGSLEWLPGKASGLSASCWPSILLQDTPLVYPFIVNDPGEGTQAKRRNGAVIIDHLTPPPQRAGSQDNYAELERLLDEYSESQHTDPRRCKALIESIEASAQHLKLDKDCKLDEAKDSDDKIRRLDQFVCTIKEHQIRNGLHIFGVAPLKEEFEEALFLYGRIPSSDNDSLYVALASDLGLSFNPNDCDFGQLSKDRVPKLLKKYLKSTRVKPLIGHLCHALGELVIACIKGTEKLDSKSFASSVKALDQIMNVLSPRISKSYADESRALMAALSGKFIAPGSSGAPSRGRWDVMPTGKNFYSVDPRSLPTATAMKLGRLSAIEMLNLHKRRHGEFPRSLALTAWGTSAMRTGGEDIALALACVGAEPLYDTATGRISGFKVIPIEEMKHPRVDITLRVSGFFRDSFPLLMDFFTSVVTCIANNDESESVNPIKSNVLADQNKLIASGFDANIAQSMAHTRVFSSKPQTYGAGINILIDSGKWKDKSELGNLFIKWGGYAYGGSRKGRSEHLMFENTLKRADAVVQNQDNKEHDILDSDDYYQFEGGMAAAIETLTGKETTIYHNDHSNPNAPKSNLLQDEIMKIVRARAVNPKWLKSIMRHGHKGGAEISATLDYLFAFAATTRSVPHHAFDLIYDAWIENQEVQSFLKKHNPQAWKDILDRMKEAWQRNLWHPKSNSVVSFLEDE